MIHKSLRCRFDCPVDRSPRISPVGPIHEGLGFGNKRGGIERCEDCLRSEGSPQDRNREYGQSDGKMDGYFKNEAIKILMPEKLQNLEKGLRAVGYGPQVDELISEHEPRRGAGSSPSRNKSSGMPSVR